MSGNTSKGGLYFGDDGSEDIGSIRYDHNDNSLEITTYGVGDRMRIDSAGNVTMSSQPAFSAVPAGVQALADGTADIAFNDTERFDQGGDFATPSFTAPVTGKYQLQCHLRIDDLKADVSFYSINLVTSNKTYDYVDMVELDDDYSYRAMTGALLVDMDASDTAKWTITQSGGTDGASIQTDSTFTGFLVC